MDYNLDGQEHPVSTETNALPSMTAAGANAARKLKETVRQKDGSDLEITVLVNNRLAFNQLSCAPRTITPLRYTLVPPPPSPAR